MLHEELYSPIPATHRMAWDKGRQEYVGHDLEGNEIVVSRSEWQAEQEAGVPTRVMQNPAHWQEQQQRKREMEITIRVNQKFGEEGRDIGPFENLEVAIEAAKAEFNAGAEGVRVWEGHERCPFELDIYHDERPAK